MLVKDTAALRQGVFSRGLNSVFFLRFGFPENHYILGFKSVSFCQILSKSNETGIIGFATTWETNAWLLNVRIRKFWMANFENKSRAFIYLFKSKHTHIITVCQKLTKP